MRRQPVLEDRILVWDNKREQRKIGVNDEALLYIAFSQDSFNLNQSADNTTLPENEKIYAKVSTSNSYNNIDPLNGSFAEDGFSIGEAIFKLVVNNIDGESTEASFKIRVTNNWHDLSMEQIT